MFAIWKYSVTETKEFIANVTFNYEMTLLKMQNNAPLIY